MVASRLLSSSFPRWLASCALVALTAACGAPTAPGGTEPGPDPRDLKIIEGPAGLMYRAHEVIVRKGTGVDSVVFENALKALGGEVVEQASLLTKNHGYLRVRLPMSVIADEAIEALQKQDIAASLERNYIVKAVKLPNDPDYSKLWGLPKINAPAAWDRNTGSKTIIVAVSDTGVDVNHPDLAANIWVNSGEVPGNGIDDDGNGYIDDVNGYDFFDKDGDPADTHGHGTHVSGTIGGVGNNGKGVVGVTWNVKIQALRFLGPRGGSSWDGAQTILYAAKNGARIVNASWGGGGPTTYLRDAINTLGAAGGLFIAAAGNSNVNTDATPHYPSSYDVPAVVSVAASTQSDNRAYFSNYGKVSVDLAAPGYQIYSTMPGNKYGSMSGTSMAAPHVAGACALALSLAPSLDGPTLKAKLLSTVKPLQLFSAITSSGGRLDLEALLAAASDAAGPPAVQGVTVKAGVRSDAEVSWTALTDADLAAYRVRWGGAPGSYSNEVVVDKSQTQATITDLTHGKTYYVVVQGIDQAKNDGKFSSEVSVTAVDQTAPPQVLDLKATPVLGDVLRGTLVSASGEFSSFWAAANAIDGSRDTAWISPARPEEKAERLEIDLLAVKTIDRIVMAPNKAYPDLFPPDIDLLASVDGKSWTIVASRRGVTLQEKELLTLPIAETQARYIRLEVLKQNKNVAGLYYASVGELEVHQKAKVPDALQLSFTAPGDDPGVGKAMRYELRYATSPIDAGNFAQATAVTMQAPTIAGAPESVVVGGLSPDTKYYFALIAYDEANNASPLSNVAEASTLAVPPTTITDLAISSQVNGTIDLSFSAPTAGGAKGLAATSYQVRYAKVPLDEATFHTATPVSKLTAPKAPGLTEVVEVKGLNAGELYYFAVKAVDADGATSALSNVVSAIVKSGPDVTAPAGVQDLRVDSSADTERVVATIDSRSSELSSGLSAAMILDQKLNTAWFSQNGYVNEPEWVVVDLGAQTLLSRFRMHPRLNSGQFMGSYPEDFEIQLSADKTVWSPVVKVENWKAQMSHWDSWHISPQVARYVRLYMPTRRAGTSVVVVGEFEARKLVHERDVLLTWSAPGDDGWLGSAVEYDLRRSTSPITDEQSFLAGSRITTTAPQPGGMIEHLEVKDLAAEAEHYFALRAKDAAGNWGPISNVGQILTPGVPPAPVSDLHLVSATKQSATLAFTATGDDGLVGTATRYDLRYSLSPIDHTTWQSATPVTGLAKPQAAGSAESVTISGLSPSTTYYVALKVEDERGNTSLLSNVVVVMTSDATPPVAVSDLAVAPVDPQTLPPVALTVVSSSGSYSSTTTAERLLDNNAATRWSTPARSTPKVEEVVFELAALTRLSRLRLRAGSGDKDLFAKAITVAVRQSASDAWRDVLVDSGLSTSGGWEEWMLGSVRAKQLRLRLDQTTLWGGKYRAILGDLEVYADTRDFRALRLSWTAPADQPTGKAKRYDLRRAASPIDAASFGQAQVVAQSLVPRAAGELERLEVSALSQETTYCFALTSEDDAGNSSAVSNSPCATTPGMPPETITDLRVSQSAGGSVTLAWTAPADDGQSGKAASYELRMATSRINTSTWASAQLVSGVQAPGAAGASETFTVNNLASHTRYYFAIRSTDGAGEISAISNNAVFVSADSSAPGAVVDLAALTDSARDGALTLRFSAPGDNGGAVAVASYEIRVSESPIDAQNFSSAILVSPPQPAAPGTLQSISVQGLKGESLYYAAMISKDAAGNASPLSNIAVARTRDEKPATISDLAVVSKGGGTSKQNATVTLSFTAPGDDGSTGQASRYELRWSTTPNFLFSFGSGTLVPTPPPASAGTVQQVTISGLAPGQQIYAALLAYDERDNASGMSNMVGVTTTDAMAPGTITDLTAQTASQSGCLTVRFTEVGDNDGTKQVQSYDLRWSTQPINAGTFTSATAVIAPPAGPVGSQRQTNVCGLPAERELHVAIRAKDNAGNWGAVSNSASARTADVAPARVSDLRLVARHLDRLDIAFTASGDDGNDGTAKRYDLRISEAPINAGNFANASAVSAPTPKTAGSAESVTVSGLQANKRYYLALIVEDERGQRSTLSNVLMADTKDNEPPAQIADLVAATGPVDRSVELRWTAVGDDGTSGRATRYELRYAKSPITAATWGAATPAPVGSPKNAGQAEMVLVSGLDGETRYHFALRAIDDDDNVGQLSPSVDAETPAVAPAAVQNLAAAAAPGKVTLTWTAPGDDGHEGTATAYEIRYATSMAGLASAAPIGHAPTPAEAGTSQSVEISGLDESTTYYFTLRTKDERGLFSGPSNTAQTVTPDVTAPGAPTGLVVVAPSLGGQSLVPMQVTGSTSLGESWSATNVSDGELTSAWASAGHAADAVDRLILDFGGNLPVDRLRLHPDGAFRQLFPQDFAIETSKDAVKWTLAREVEGFSADEAIWYEWGFPATSARYVRLRVTKGGQSGHLYYSAVAEASVLSARAAEGQAELSFIAPGDDGTVGTATSYQVYRSDAPFDQNSLGSATLVSGAPLPALSGTLQNLTVTGLPGETTYYWAVRAVDEAGNLGALSAVVSAQTNAVAPDPITDLAAVASATTQTSLTLEWTATGDDGKVGTATSYELRYVVDAPLTAQTFPLATEVTTVPLPAAPGTRQSVTISGLDPGTLYRFALVAKDEAQTASYLSNVLTVKTTPAPDTTAPDAVADLTTALPLRGDVPLALSYDSCSSEQLPGFTADALVDGLASSAWSPAPRLQPAADEWVIVDLGSEQEIDRARLSARQGYEDLFPRALEIELSTDKLAWSKVAGHSQVGAVTAPIELTFPVTTARYVRLRVKELAPQGNGYYYGVVAELAVLPPNTPPGTVYVSFTASGDDGSVGRATAYDLRVGACPYDHATATPVTLPDPQLAGAPERLRLDGLSAGDHCFGLKVVDEAGNESALSNVSQITVQ